MLSILFACTAFADSERADIEQLFQQERWQELLSSFSETTTYTADLFFYKGIALAHLSKFEEAEDTFRKGLKIYPRDKRFYQELAGLYFNKRSYKNVKDFLHQAHELDPEDAYTNEFLGTIYFLEENLEAALLYWNELNKPQIDEFQISPLPDIDPVLLDGAFAASPQSLLTISDLYHTQRNLNQLEAFARYRIHLKPTEKGTFDLVVNSVERPTWIKQPLERSFRTFRNIFLETIHPEFYNLDNRGTHLLGMLRWDQENLRASATLSFPFKSKAGTRIMIDTGWREEEWDLTQSIEGPLFASEFLEMSRVEAGIELKSQTGSRWGWFNGARISKVEFSGDPIALRSSNLFSQGWTLEYFAGLEADLFRLPQKRFKIESNTKLSIAKKFANSSFRFGKFESQINTTWFPKSKGDDLLTQFKFRFGKGFGNVPFEEMYILGVEEDTDLWLRAHKGLRKKRKGSNPMGSEYVLMNFEIDKLVYENGFFQWKLSPFVDTGGIRDPEKILGSAEWLIDTGIQSKLRVLRSITVLFVYGKNLRTGGNTFFITGAI